MKKLQQNLYITYSNQKARDLKRSALLKPFDNVITLDNLIIDLYEKKNYQTLIDDTMGSSIIYYLINKHKIDYFSYLNCSADSLTTIFTFIIKCKRNEISFNTILNNDKLDAVVKIDELYQEFKQAHNLADIADIEENVCNHWNILFNDAFENIFVQEFIVHEISFIKSKFQEKILKKLSKYPFIKEENQQGKTSKIIKPKNEVFDNIDEVKTAIKIARKLLEEGESASEIIIVASDIAEYVPLYKLFLAEYELQGFSSIGTSLSGFYDLSSPKVKSAYNQYEAQLKSLGAVYKRLGLSLDNNIEENLKSGIKILDEKIGIEITEPNQLVGSTKTYKHIIFIGTDINHFPPKSSDNFLYTYDNDIEYFYANNYFTSSSTQLKELKRLSENLYIITASYSGKRELSPSILLDGVYDETIDVSSVKSINELALENKTTKLDLTYLDNVKVEGVKATHLSASQINNYLGCPLRYLYSNKIKLQAPNQSEEGFDVMEQGSLMHLCYELFGKKIKDNHIDSVDQSELYELMYQVSFEAYRHKDTVEPRGKPKLVENIHHQIFLSTLQAGLKDDRETGLLAKFVNYYIKNAAEFNYFKSTEFEKEFALDENLEPYRLNNKEDKNYFIKGFIDRFDDLENHINIVDYKSKKVERVDKNKQEEVDTQKDIQLSLYILYAKQQYPNKSYDSHLLSFKGNEKGVKFASLSNDDVYTDEFEADLKQLIFDTKENIEAGKFRFDNSDEKMCGYCDYKFICHENILNKIKE